MKLELELRKMVTGKLFIPTLLLLGLVTVIWIPEIIDYIQFYGLINGQNLTLQTYGTSTVYIHTWSITTITSVTPIAIPIYWMWWIVGWQTVGYNIAGYVTAYTALESVPITGALPIFSSWLLKISIPYVQLLEVLLIGLGALFLILYLFQRKSFQKSALNYIIPLAAIIMIFLGGAIFAGAELFELKNIGVAFLGIVCIYLGRHKHDQRFTILGILCIASVLIMYLTFYQLSQTVLSEVTSTF